MAKGTSLRQVVGVPKLWFRDPVGAGLWCPGCHAPLVQRLVCEVLEEMGLEGRAIGNSGAGCISLFFFALKIDSTYSAHGRVPDVMTAIKRLRPHCLVFSVQGDGDTFAIGTEAVIQTAARGEKITVIMTNNGCYGNTGGQMAPTTVLGQKLSTCSNGRNSELHGYPIRACELLATLEGTVYCARGAVNNPVNYRRTKGFIKTAFEKQLNNEGFSFVEILCVCPPNWHMTPLESLQWLEEKIIPQMPLGVIKDERRSCDEATKI
jgi:2-oxoglutarate ferredoxin oxidoreductase subunit beta